MPKYFFNRNAVLRDGTVFIKGETARHLLHSLRYKPGQAAVFCDGEGKDYHCVFEGAFGKKDELNFRVSREEEVYNELPYKVTLYQAVIASGKMELAIQKSTELGVDKIVPVFTRFSGLSSGISSKNERYQRIAESAAEQSMRGRIPEVLPAVKFEDAVARAGTENVWLAAYEKERAQTVNESVNSMTFSNNKNESVNSMTFSNNKNKLVNSMTFGIWVGPEGGFDAGEITMLEKAGAKAVTLGKRILRSETAGPAMLVQLQCALGAELL